VPNPKVTIRNTTLHRCVQVTDAFSFPESLDLTALVEPLPGGAEASAAAASDPQLFELAAILIHKGAAATGGHYVAHVKHEATAQWWCFDDMEVIHPRQKSCES
jgi:uncharacterized UBP type Zn finger protein